MKHWTLLLPAMLLLALGVSMAQSQDGNTQSVRVALVKMPYVGERNVPDTSRGPEYLEEGGIRKLLEEQGVQTK
jgi:hypothetical protein